MMNEIYFLYSLSGRNQPKHQHISQYNPTELISIPTQCLRSQRTEGGSEGRQQLCSEAFKKTWNLTQGKRLSIEQDRPGHALYSILHVHHRALLYAE